MKRSFTPFHVRLAQLRKAHGFSYRQLQDEMEKEGVSITHTALRKWEIGVTKNRIPSLTQVAALSRVFNVETSFLLEEMFNKRSTKDNRQAQWADVDLLTEEQHESLLKLKNSLLESGHRGVNGNGQEGS